MFDHRATILDQFTKQALPFSTGPAIRDERALQLLVEMSGAGPDDTVLDVACGPGLVVCAFAAVVRHATGIDVTPAMLDRARALQQEKGLANVSWQVGEVPPLPYPDGAFAVVVSRYAFHHLLDPRAVFAEMVRVCRPRGRVVLADVYTTPETAVAYDAMEKLRDPSHVRALLLAEMEETFHGAGLRNLRTAFYRMEVQLERVLQHSFPNSPQDTERIRELFAKELEHDGMKLGTRLVDGKVWYDYPIAVFVGEKP